MYIARVGHDRSPIFLDGPGALHWLGSEGRVAKELKQILEDHRPSVKWHKERVRAMKPGWEKRG